MSAGTNADGPTADRIAAALLRAAHPHADPTDPAERETTTILAIAYLHVFTAFRQGNAGKALGLLAEVDEAVRWAKG